MFNNKPLKLMDPMSSMWIRYALLLCILVNLLPARMLANGVSFPASLEGISQDCMDYLPNTKQANEVIVPYDARQVMDNFLQHYFEPWHNPLAAFTLATLQAKEEQLIAKYKQEPGWGLNKHPYDQLAYMQQNINLDAFPNLQQAAIVLRTTNLRRLPSHAPSFTDWTAPGRGYPFDNLQESLLVANEPVYVLHQSKDKAWQFVATNSHLVGWVNSLDVAYVSPEFMKAWKTGHYITPLQDQVLVAGQGINPLARIGQLFPLAQEQPHPMHDCVLVATANPNQEAVIKLARINKSVVSSMPLPATPNNVARLANALMGQAYGWGGLCHYRDCSSMVKDLMFAFGIWLPRDSGPQAQSGHFIHLANLSNSKKQQLIAKKGIPFFTLLWFPGHIALYIGSNNKKAYIFHTLWGLKTIDQTTQEQGRAVIGKAVIMSLDLGAGHQNIPGTLLHKAQGMVLLNKRLSEPQAALALPTKTE